jgi:protein-S-isoprenylcysteine O-methyltransferase Ste14
MLLGAVGLALVAVGVVYLVVECQALPGFLGPTRGDTSPRTGLGIAGVLLGLAVLALALLAARRHPPNAPRRS